MENICAAYQHIGYKRHPTIKNKLVIDEKTKDIVEKIFNMYASGHGSHEIANYLNKNKYLSPAGYRKTGVIQDKNKTDYNWNEVTLCNMLKNEVYIGNTIQNKKTTISYKVKKIKKIEKEDQIKVYNTHESIIDKDVFKKVQCILEKKGTNTKLKYDYLLRGMIYCYHCKRKLQIVLKKNSKSNSAPHPYITCSNTKQTGCYPLNINYQKFESHIIDIVRKICQTYSNPELFYSIYEKYKNKNNNKKEDYKNKIKQIDKAIFEINNNLDDIYIDKLRGTLQEEDYIRISREFYIKQSKPNKTKRRIKAEIK